MDSPPLFTVLLVSLHPLLIPHPHHDDVRSPDPRSVPSPQDTFPAYVFRWGLRLPRPFGFLLRRLRLNNHFPIINPLKTCLVLNPSEFYPSRGSTLRGLGPECIEPLFPDARDPPHVSTDCNTIPTVSDTKDVVVVPNKTSFSLWASFIHKDASLITKSICRTSVMT